MSKRKKFRDELPLCSPPAGTESLISPANGGDQTFRHARLDFVHSGGTIAGTSKWRLAVSRDARPGNSAVQNLEDGATLNEFLKWFPGVTRERALAVLEFAQASLATA